VSRLIALSGRRFFIRHPWQLALAVAGVGLGVAVVTGVDLAGNAASRAFDASRAAVAGSATHQLVSQSGDLADTTFSRLKVDIGVLSAAPVLEGRISLSDGRVLTLSGIDPLSEKSFRDYGTSLDSGTGLRGLLVDPAAVLATPGLAASMGLRLGDSIEVEASGRRQRLRLAGFLMPGAAEGPILQDYLFADVATAQEVLGAVGRLTRIDLILSPAELERVQAWLPPDLELVSTAARSQHMQEMTRAFRVNLFALSLLALLVGAFLIFSTMSFLVVQRRNVIGTLRTIGVTRRQLFSSVLQESFIVGVPGTLIGLSLGWLLGNGLTALVVRTIDDLYFRLQVAGIPLDWLALTKGALLGLGVTVAASLGPAAEAAAVAPRSVLSRASLERRARRRLPWLAFAAVIVAVISSLLLSADTRSLAPGFAGMFGIIVVGALLAPPAIVLFMSSLLHGLRPLLDMPLRMAIRGVNASLSRTGVAVSALMVAVATVVGVGLMVGSFRASVDQWLQDSLRSDVYVSLDDAWYAAGGDPEALARALDARAEVAEVTRSVRTRLLTDDGEIRLWGLDPGRGEWGLPIISGDATTARRAFDNGRAVVVSEPYARRSGLAVGDSLLLPSARGPRAFPVAAIFRDYTSDRGVIAVSLSVFREVWEIDRVDGIGLIAADEVDPAEVRRAADELLGSAPGVRIASNREIRRASLQIFDRTFTITRVLQLLVGIVAFLGILSALQSLQMERVRELAVLRALGWSPGQVRRLVLSQTVLLGLAAGLLAMPLGIALAAVLIHVINLRAFAWTMGFSMDAAVLVQGMLLAVSAAFIGGLYPAWRSAGRRPAADLRDE
jgi:putative ABC transport system permease protein